MRRTTRRRLLAAVCGGAAGVAGCAGLSGAGLDGTPSDTATPAPVPTATADGGVAAATVDTVVSFDDLGPNSLAVDGEGAVYVGAGIAGQVRKLPTDRTGATGLSPDATERVATLETRDGFLLGIAIHERTLYAALSSRREETHGIWRVPLNGDPPATRVAPFDTDLQLREVFVDESRNRLLVAHDRRGTVSAVDPVDGTVTTWLAHDLLEAPTRGATGLAAGADGDVLVTNYERGRIVRVPVADDGSPGEPTVAVEDAAGLSGAAGLAADDGMVYVAARNLNRILRIPPSGTIETLATADDGLDLPTDVAFAGAGEDGVLFVANFGFEPMVGLTGDPSLVRLEL